MSFEDVNDPANAAHAIPFGPQRPRKALILCFDGTGNKFQGDSGDSNILKIFSLIDRESHLTHSYYQPGIGTYIEDSALSKTSRLAKLRSAYLKAKDQAVGTSFGDHVVGGYKFLMRYYSQGDDIYFFGFSRGAYLARFLAQMLDAVGLLSRGNEEMIRFAWKAFSQWQTRLDQTEQQKKEKTKNFEFMHAFRETFSRPVRRLRFLGLFDTVNAVPRFETAWMRRTKHPYTSKSSAIVVRHAVSIDERRAKFRQNLISEKKSDRKRAGKQGFDDSAADVNGAEPPPAPLKRHQTFGGRYKPRRDTLTVLPTSRNASRRGSVSSVNSAAVAHEAEDDEDAEQDIQEIWFPGCHADIGGGWPLEPGLQAGLSHGPLLWMVREARKAGIPFRQEALEAKGYLVDDQQDDGDAVGDITSPERPIPQIQVDDAPLTTSNGPSNERKAEFFDLLQTACTKGMIHDSLKFNRGTPHGGVVAWNMMEYLPFRRMDLRSDGTWKPIRWPLPFGEPRDIPDDAWIHHTALLRLDGDKDYRPGNLIIGGGGRGVKVAPARYGKGEWLVHREKGNPVGQVYIRAPRQKNGETEK